MILNVTAKVTSHPFLITEDAWICDGSTYHSPESIGSGQSPEVQSPRLLFFLGALFLGDISLKMVETWESPRLTRLVQLLESFKPLRGQKCVEKGILDRLMKEDGVSSSFTNLK